MSLVRPFAISLLAGVTIVLCLAGFVAMRPGVVLGREFLERYPEPVDS